MTTPIARFIHRPTIATLRAALLTIVVIAAPFLYAQEASQHAADDEHNSTATLVRQVRDATREFTDVNNATAAGYGPLLGLRYRPGPRSHGDPLRQRSSARPNPA